MLRGIAEAGHGNDGFRGLLYLNKRFDRRTQASLLQAYLEVMSPLGIKGVGILFLPFTGGRISALPCALGIVKN